MEGSPGRAVLLHGFTGSSAAWGEGVLDGLSRAGIEPVPVDLPGHGKETGNADPESFTLGATLELVSAAADWPADLVGYSMGARLALQYVAARPERVRRLVLESGSPGLATEAERRERIASDEALAAEILENGVAAFVDSWEERPIFETRRRLDEGVRARQKALKQRNDPRSLAASLRGLGTGALPSLWGVLGHIETPTLVLVGALDQKFVELGERMAAALPDARLVVVPDAGHAVHQERPEAWLAAVTDFLG